MRLNPDKYTFGVQARKFLGFLLTSRGIEANPDKFREIINMRSPSTVKDVQQLIGCLTALSHFLSCARDKSIHFFVEVRKSTKFQWAEKCEEAFKEVNHLLSAPPSLYDQGRANHLSYT